jgi:hypothetical protein
MYDPNACACRRPKQATVAFPPRDGPSSCQCHAMAECAQPVAAPPPGGPRLPRWPLSFGACAPLECWCAHQRARLCSPVGAPPLRVSPALGAACARLGRLRAVVWPPRVVLRCGGCRDAASRWTERRLVVASTPPVPPAHLRVPTWGYDDDDDEAPSTPQEAPGGGAPRGKGLFSRADGLTSTAFVPCRRLPGNAVDTSAQAPPQGGAHGACRAWGLRRRPGSQLQNWCRASQLGSTDTPS